MSDAKDRASGTSPIFVSAIRAIIRQGAELEIFSSDYTDDLPEAKELDADFRATTIDYRAPSKMSGVWLMFTEMSSKTLIPGYHASPVTSYTELLVLCEEKPRYERSVFASSNSSPTLSY